ncbi:uncharacterized protein METZ01_LOCUS390676 [marine metagenome]|uniref:Uncharacterized protein n=1 Tax=marine metagenome TaxID=408172 RepID=A0A382UU93_9ZZZZ
MRFDLPQPFVSAAEDLSHSGHSNEHIRDCANYN